MLDYGARGVGANLSDGDYIRSHSFSCERSIIPNTKISHVRPINHQDRIHGDVGPLPRLTLTQEDAWVWMKATKAAGFDDDTTCGVQNANSRRLLRHVQCNIMLIHNGPPGVER